MKKHLLLAYLLIAAVCSHAQKIDSIYFHLYTDSLKRGQHNYINVDGKTADGHWLPLTGKELLFTSNEGIFDGNELILPPDFAPAHVRVKAVLKANPSIFREITIWIKTLPDPPLPTQQDMNRPRRRS